MKHITRHHIVPRSRGGRDTSDNIAKVDNKKHELYHELFVNKTPNEIIDYLVSYFWKGQIGWVKHYLWDKKRGIL